MTETTEEGRTGEVVTAEATGWQHRNSLLAAAAEDRSDVFACLQRVDVAVMLIQRTSCTTARVVVSERRGQFEIATLPVGLLLSESSAYFIGKCYFETRHSERNNSPTCEFSKIFHNEYHQSQSFYITEVSRKMVLSDGDTKSLAKFYKKKKKSIKKKNHNVSPYRCCGVVQASGRLDRIQLGSGQRRLHAASFAKIPAVAFRNWGHSHAS